MADNREEQGAAVDNPNSTIWKAGHPLLNPVVASTIFKFVKLSELRSLRLVCKDWKSASLPIWRREVQINIHDGTCNQRNLLKWESLGTKLNDVAGEQPFRNFRLQSTQFLADISRPSKYYPRNKNPASFEGTYRNMERFWRKYGHWIHKLELKDVYVTDVEAFKRAIFEQTLNLRELTLDKMTDGRGRDGDTGAPIPLPVKRAKTLKDEDLVSAALNLNLKVFAIKDDHPKLPFGWRLLFDCFPNMQKLELAEPKKPADDFFDCVEGMLRNPARRQNLPITDLRLKDFMAAAVKRLLQMPQVKLQVLHLTHLTLGKNADEEVDIFQTAMQIHGNTLRELHFENEYNSKDYWGALVGPYPNLTELEMKGSAYVFNFHFLNKLPNLKVLRLKQLDEEEMLKGTDWTVVEIMPHLREFYFIVTQDIYSEVDVLSEEDVEGFTKVMPNLECFTGQLTNLTLRVVCRNWKQLKKLVISSGQDFEGMSPSDADNMDIDDVGITGIVRRRRGSDERVPCVADLKELRHLSMEHVTLIGNASVVDGFYKLPHLSSLEICESNLISRKVLASLKRRLQGGLTVIPLFGGLMDDSDY